MEDLVKKFLKKNDCFYLKKNFKNAKQSPFMSGFILTNSEGETVTVTKQLFADDVINVNSGDFNESYLYNRDEKKFEVTKSKNSLFGF